LENEDDGSLKIKLIPLLIVFSLILTLSTQQIHAHEPSGAPAEKSFQPKPSDVPIYGYRIVRIYPHDPTAFTQGLIYKDGYLYEGTGLHGRSSLRKVDLETGRVLKFHPLPEKYFGEGIALCRNRLFQLTYRSNTGFIYDRDFRQIGQFTYPTEGWGITCGGKHLIMSDGTAVLRWLDSKTLKIIKQLTVTDQGRPVPHLNELETVRGEIFANIWGTDFIARISPESGIVTGWIDLSGLSGQLPAGREPIDVLNGIAYNERGNRLFVTGKFWPKLFEIKLIRIK
jgi:glutaminyl-peptide cyclotransferase